MTSFWSGLEETRRVKISSMSSRENQEFKSPRDPARGVRISSAPPFFEILPEGCKSII
jgi:hypothetical protein